MTEPQRNHPERSKIWRLTGMNNCETETDFANNKTLTFWCLGWAAAIIGATWLIKTFTELPAPLTWLIALLPNVLAVFALVAYLRFLRMTDELQRRIQLEGLAVGFGVGWIFAIGYLVFQAAGAPELPITAMILVMTAGWITGTLRAVRHYQ